MNGKGGFKNGETPQKWQCKYKYKINKQLKEGENERKWYLKIGRGNGKQKENMKRKRNNGAFVLDDCQRVRCLNKDRIENP